MKTFAALRAPTFLPAFLVNVLFGWHWLYYALALVIAVFLLWQGFKRGDLRLKRVGGVLLVIVLCWGLLGFIFVTPRERLSNAHYRILDAARHGNVNGIMHLLAGRFHYGPLDRVMVQQQLQALFGHLKVTGNTVRKLKMTVHGRAASSRFNVFTTTSDGSVLTRWTLRWRDERRAGNWRMISATLRSVNNNQVPPGFGLSGNYP
jgi:hypothetical protein